MGFMIYDLRFTIDDDPGMPDEVSSNRQSVPPGGSNRPSK